MARTPKPTSEIRSYLADPNYYRLAYQLAAQLFHRELSRDPDHVPDPGVSAGQIWPPDQSPEALATAQRLIGRAQFVVGIYGVRQLRGRRWRPWRPPPLEAREQRLARFLSEAMIPGAELLAAGILVHLERREDAERYAAPLRRRAERRELTHRVYYNLACYETSLGEEHLSDALAALRLALSESKGAPRAMLVDWAQKDPSLAGVREDPRTAADFRALVATYESAEPPATTKD